MFKIGEEEDEINYNKNVLIVGCEFRTGERRRVPFLYINNEGRIECEIKENGDIVINGDVRAHIPELAMYLLKNLDRETFPNKIEPQEEPINLGSDIYTYEKKFS